MNIPEKFWKASLAAVILLAVFLLVVSIKELKAIGYVGKADQYTSSISVSGTGEAVAIPDIATFSFTVSETAKAVVDAQGAATTRTNAALKAIKDGGVEDKDIQTTSYNINPHYEYQSSVCSNAYCPGGKSILTGYEVSQTVTVKVRDLSKAGKLFSAIGALGVQNVNGLTFAVDEPESVKAEARAKAIADAQAKAKVLAKQLGVSIVSIISYNEDGGYPMAYGMGGDSMVSAKVASAPTPEIPVGENKVKSNVTITYEIR